MRGYSTKTFSNPTVQMQQRLLVNPTSSQPGISSEVKLTQTLSAAVLQRNDKISSRGRIVKSKT